MNRSVERRLDPRGGAAENYRAVAGGEFFHLHAMTLEPSHDLGRIGVGDAEALAILLGREPLMVVRRLGVGLRVDQLIQNILLRLVRQQHEKHVSHGEVGRDCAVVIFGERQGMHVAAQCDSLFVINEAGDAVSHLDERRLGERKIRGGSGAGGAPFAKTGAGRPAERSDKKSAKVRNERARRCGDADDMRDIPVESPRRVQVFTSPLASSAWRGST